LEKLVDNGVKKVLITGGFGYLGGRIAETLSNFGIKVVIGSHRRQVNVCENTQKYDTVFIDLLDENSLNLACSNIFAIIHLAAMNSEQCENQPEQALLVNGTGTSNLLNAADSQGVKRFLYFSTVHVYGSDIIGKIDESSITDPSNSYAITHKIAEDYVALMSKDQKMESVVFRLSNAVGSPIHEGVNCWALLINDLCKQVALSGQMNISSSQFNQRDFIPISNICNVVLYFLGEYIASEWNCVYNLTSGGGTSFQEVVDLISTRVHKIKGFFPKVTFDNKDGDFIGEGFSYSSSKLDNLKITKTDSIECELDRLISNCYTWFNKKENI
jgi:UDP-glucose 4-epimerase